MRYWWASQGRNYQHAASQRRLWTCPPANGGSLRSRELIKELTPGDLVFHYANKELRVLSEVTASWVPWPRPENHPPKPGEHDDGWLVTTDPWYMNLEIPLGVLQEVLEHGSPSPLNKNGMPVRKFLSELNPGDAALLLSLIGAEADRSETQAEPDQDRVWSGGTTSALREKLARSEQAALRGHLLAGATHGPCNLCGRDLPSELLVAAHIVPRHRLTDDERRELSRIAMLACALGCDALFEHGYIAVDTTGTVRDFTGSGSLDASVHAKDIAGQRCDAHTPATAGRFAEHYAQAQYRRQESPPPR
ncbi:MAG: HNH endonuclease [Brachybacterium sp.]|uniref:HNH endonuclease signature motif containing protein n=1 Tax=Brachybacterium sp. TaxID=1891286 RepID=UPI00264965DE|nr:HNH endonuclease signature motif containing protein [Brachybacterium sp.]MDN5686203.1 HNH endonuclease [Brachybacterium sp.]